MNIFGPAWWTFWFGALVKYVVKFRWNLKRNIKATFCRFFAANFAAYLLTTSLRKFAGKTSSTIFRQLHLANKYLACGHLHEHARIKLATIEQSEDYDDLIRFMTYHPNFILQEYARIVAKQMIKNMLYSKSLNTSQHLLTPINTY